MESPDFPPIQFPATPKNVNQNSPLLTSQQNRHTLRWLMFGFPRFLWNRKSLSVGRGVFVVLDKLERNLLWNGFVGDQKSSWKFFDGNSRKFIESTHLYWNCLMFLWSSCLRGNSRWILGLKWAKWMIFSVSRFSCFFCFSFYRISFKNFWNFQWISGNDFNNSLTHLDW